MNPHAHTIAAEWTRRVEAEYRSAALTADLAHWLLQVGASHDLIRAALAIVDDELVHAELGAAVVRAICAEAALATAPPSPPLARDSLTFGRTWEPLELDVAAACVENFCLGETIAVPLFLQMRKSASAPAARAALDRIVADEVRHRDFGWLLLEWLLACPEGPRVRRFVAHQLPSMCARLEASYAALADEAAVPEPTLAWGLMAGSAYARIVGQTARREWLPRFAELGFDAAALAPVQALLRLDPRHTPDGHLPNDV